MKHIVNYMIYKNISVRSYFVLFMCLLASSKIYSMSTIQTPSAERLHEVLCADTLEAKFKDIFKDFVKKTKLFTHLGNKIMPRIDVLTTVEDALYNYARKTDEPEKLLFIATHKQELINLILANSERLKAASVTPTGSTPTAGIVAPVTAISAVCSAKS